MDVCVNEKIQLIEAEFGLKGFAVVVKLYQHIFGGSGYYCEWTNEVALLFSRRICEGYSAVSEIVSASIKRGIFDQKLYDEYFILTSKGIQKRYFEAVSRRTSFEIKKEYLLVDVTHFSKNAYISAENVNKNTKNVNRNEQSREEKSRVKKSKVNNSPLSPHGETMKMLSEYSNNFKTAFKSFMEMRTKIRKPMTARAVELTLSKLDKLAGNEQEKIAILEQSTMNSWVGVFALKEPERSKENVYTIGEDGQKYDRGGFKVF